MTAVGPILTVIAIAVSIFLWWLTNRRRVLLYSTPVVTSLLSSPPDIAQGDIKVLFKNHPLTNPHLVELRVESRSRKDISDQDFNAHKPLIIRLGTS